MDAPMRDMDGYRGRDMQQLIPPRHEEIARTIFVRSEERRVGKECPV